ncbi:hypothetical protein SAMN05892877_111200 [Rhizobium subbaraonis]|uniref:DUF3426 domain-containing protein n=1 Tax=Rhizobium subbaraonis TaxID=908946 RepID=A0A285UQN5_9HYPH|nr:hypothetical protein [Rhizobium subbaraonis]SOC43698.1 hypothetical protein SAMN05892877_111200 [Rhizobium subbaraonis]
MTAFGARRERSVPFDLLPPEPGRQRRSPVPRRKMAEIVDADFVVVTDSPAAPRGIARNDNGLPGTSGLRTFASSGAGMTVRGLVRAVRLVEQALQILPARAFGTIVAGSVAGSFFFAGGLSALATVFSAGGEPGRLQVGGVTYSLDDRDGMKVLSIYGTLENRSREERAVPSILVDVVGGGRGAARHRIELTDGSMPAGASRPFALKIPHTGAGLPKVAVSLASEDALQR